MHLLNIFAPHATLTGSGEKKTGPSRFIADFSSMTMDPISPIFNHRWAQSANPNHNIKKSPSKTSAKSGLIRHYGPEFFTAFQPLN
jgi:hypothetical protein